MKDAGLARDSQPTTHYPPTHAIQPSSSQEYFTKMCYKQIYTKCDEKVPLIHVHVSLLNLTYLAETVALLFFFLTTLGLYSVASPSVAQFQDSL